MEIQGIKFVINMKLSHEFLINRSEPSEIDAVLFGHKILLRDDELSVNGTDYGYCLPGSTVIIGEKVVII